MNSKHVWTKIEGYEDWKIYPNYRSLYFECLKSSTYSAIKSWERINKIIENFNTNKENFELIDLAENIINQAGIISRYFFPTKDKYNIEKNRIHQLRGEKLRELFSIDSDNILANRKFRNYIEHFDENLDQFLNKPVAGNIYPKVIFINSNEVDSTMYLFKVYIINEFKLVSLNEEIEIYDLAKEIYRIYNLTIYPN